MLRGTEGYERGPDHQAGPNEGGGGGEEPPIGKDKPRDRALGVPSEGSSSRGSAPREPGTRPDGRSLPRLGPPVTETGAARCCLPIAKSAGARE